MTTLGVAGRLQSLGQVAQLLSKGGGMFSRRLRRLLVAGAASCAALTLALPGASAMAAPVARATAPRAALPALRGARRKMIVIFKDQFGALHSLPARARAERSVQRPVVSALKAAGVRGATSLALVNAVAASLSADQVAALRHDPAVSAVVPNGTITGPSLASVAPRGSRLGALGGSRLAQSTGGASTSFCSSTSPSAPELDPQALSNINAVAETNGTATVNGVPIDGSGVTVAYLADGIDTSSLDFLRNPAYASPASPASAPVVKQVDFSSDGPSAPTGGGEAFLDASSIAAQGNNVYNLNSEFNTVPSSPDCYIKIVGAAPGASVLGLKVFAQTNTTTNSAFVQAIQYAVSQKVKVLDESFGATEMPETTADLVKQADNAAVAAGVTVVVSAGDGGFRSTQGSPATDPNVIDVGASTTFRAYEQNDFGGAGWPGASGGYSDNNISSLSSGGYSQLNARTVDLVAPGDLNWAVCSTSSSFADCGGKPIQLTGGTSEAAPLTAAAAADVIQAYAATHGGTDPSPAMVKEILMSTARNIGATAVEQGAGLLDVSAAVSAAEAMPGSTTGASAGLVVTSAPQVNITQAAGATSTVPITIENTSGSSQSVKLQSTTRSETPLLSQSGSFCMQPSPSSATSGCPANTGTMTIWSGVTEVYQNETFTVPSSGANQLVFRADYQNTGQSSPLHVSLFDPSGNLAGYSLPQGVGDYAQVEVNNPAPGPWTAVFFTIDQDTTPGQTGTSGNVQWQADSYGYTTPSSTSFSPQALTIPAGSSGTFTMSVTSSQYAGDTNQLVQAVDASSPSANSPNIPVTVRTLVPADGVFSGLLTGGNGRAGSPAQTNTYQFEVPAGESNLDVYLHFNDPRDALVATLTNPSGQVVSTDVNRAGYSVINAYHLDPQAGLWTLSLFWQNPVSGDELSQRFDGVVTYNQVNDSASLPTSSATTLVEGRTTSYPVRVTNNGTSPESYFVDPRLTTKATYAVTDLSGSNDRATLPKDNGFIYAVPPFTSNISAGLVSTPASGASAALPVTFDTGLYLGDPDYEATSNCASSDTASLDISQPTGSGAAYGLWFLQPAECGPFSAPAGSTNVTASFEVTTNAFDPSVSSSTGNLWSDLVGLTSSFSGGLTLNPGQSGTITVAITPQGPPGVHSGTLYLDDQSQAEFGLTGDTLQAFPYSYDEIAPAAAPTHVSAKAGHRSARVSWTAPSNTGGSAITGYQVTAEPAAGNPIVRTYKTPATAETFTGLTNGTSYSFTVAAISAAGTGATSARSNAVTPRALSHAKLSRSRPRVIFGQEGAEHFYVAVTPPGATGRVVVKFFSGRRLCLRTLSRGRASCRLGRRELKPGRYTLKALYEGNRSVAGSVSLKVVLVVARARRLVRQRRR